jgi:Transcriptional regulator, AbiEi antitoxin
MLTPDPQLAVDYGLFSVAQAIAAGMSRREIERGLRRGRWDRPERGILRTVGRGRQPGDELLLAVLRGGPGAVAGFESAAEVHGWDLLKPPAKPKLIVPQRSYQPPGAASYSSNLAPDETMLVGVLPISTPVRSGLDIAATAPLDDAVVALDSGLRSRTVFLPELQAAFAASQRHGVCAARKALALADPQSGSVPESQARLLFHHAGLPAPITQHTVYSATGQFIARTDFAWPWARLIGEIDGFRYHSDSPEFQKDRTTQNALVKAGWRVIRFTVYDIRSCGPYVVAYVWQAL